MGTIKNYYLIDYENVHEGGLSGYGELGMTDYVVIVYTPNAKKIDMNSIPSNGNHRLKRILVKPGKQSADKHIVSFLGYLIGKYGKNCKISIVSRDKDYDNVVEFWKQEGFSVLRIEQLKDNSEQQEKPLNKKAELHREVLKAVRKSGFDESVANTVAKLATQMYGHKYMLEEMHTALKERYCDYKDVYVSVKPILSKYQ